MDETDENNKIEKSETNEEEKAYDAIYRLF
jgi:hypothetical protein